MPGPSVDIPTVDDHPAPSVLHPRSQLGVPQEDQVVHLPSKK